MAKLKKYKARPTANDVKVWREAKESNLEQNKKVNEEKFEKEKEYINNKLIEMVDATLSVIDKETTPQQLDDMLRMGDKEWKKFCAIQRTRKIKVPIEMYTQTMIANLINKGILTNGQEVKDESANVAEASGDKQEIVLDNPLEQNGGAE